MSSSGTIDSSQENYETSDEEMENVATPSVTRSQSIPQQPPEFGMYFFIILILFHRFKKKKNYIILHLLSLIFYK